jgi:hypothetical protein
MKVYAEASPGSVDAVASLQARIRESLALSVEGRYGITRDESARWSRDWSVLGGLEYRW